MQPFFIIGPRWRWTFLSVQVQPILAHQQPFASCIKKGYIRNAHTKWNCFSFSIFSLLGDFCNPLRHKLMEHYVSPPLYRWGLVKRRWCRCFSTRLNGWKNTKQHVVGLIIPLGEKSFFVTFIMLIFPLKILALKKSYTDKKNQLWISPCKTSQLWSRTLGQD